MRLCYRAEPSPWCPPHHLPGVMEPGSSWGLGTSFQGLHWGAVLQMCSFKPQMSVLCSLFHHKALHICNTTSVVMRLVVSLVSPGGCGALMSISSWVQLQLCLTKASCSSRVKISFSLSLSILQPNTLNALEGFIAFSQLTKRESQREVIALVLIPNSKLLDGFPNSPRLSVPTPSRLLHGTPH